MKQVTILSFFALFLILPASASDLKPADVLILFNTQVEESEELAQFYQKERSIPKENLLGMAFPDSTKLSRGQYQKFLLDFEIALASKDTSANAIAIMFGVPYKITRDGKENNEASVDSELALKLPTNRLNKWMTNPFFKKEIGIGRYRENLSKVSTPRLVTRIDGPSLEDCKRIISDSIATEKQGLWGVTYLDKALKGGGYKLGDNWLDKIEQLNWTHGIPTMKDSSKFTLPTDFPLDNASVYFGWYTRHANGPLLHPSFKFKRGAVATHIHSFSAIDLRSQKNGWVGALVKKGACAVLGNVHEPYLQLTTHLDIFYDRLLKGYSFAEASYMATPALSWQTVMIGDPLYRPFLHLEKVSGTIAEEDKDYRTMCILWRLNAGKKEDILRKLRSAAAKSESANMYEYIGMWNEYLKDYKHADLFYLAAGNQTESESQKIRLCLQRAYIHLGKGYKKEALEILENTIKTFPDASHKRAVHSLKLMHNPPPPPKKK